MSKWLAGLLVVPLGLLAGCEPGGAFSLAPAATSAMPTASAPNSQPSSYPVFSQPGVKPANVEELADQVVDAVNAERAKSGLQPVVLSDRLSQIADDYANRMVMGDFFSHDDPFNGSTVARRAMQKGYMFYKVGENLAAGQQDVTEAMKDWMDSPSHRANILDPDFKEMGLGIRDGGRHGRYWVQEFGRPLGQ